MKKDVLNVRNFKLGLEILCAGFWIVFGLCFVLYLGSTESSEGAILEFGRNLLKNYPVIAGITIVYGFAPSLIREHLRERKAKEADKHNLI